MKKKTKSKLQKLSVREFKVWLDGLCSFNTSEWVPNLEQWTLIKDRIMSLDESSDKPNLPNNPQPQFRHPVNRPTFSPEPIIPQTEFPQLSPDDLAAKLEKAKTTGPAVKTPHIDSTNGYSSQFV